MQLPQHVPEHQRVSVLGSNYSVVNFDDVAGRLARMGLDKMPGYVCVSNVHTTMMGFFDHQYQQITNESTFSVPDGMPIRWAMQLLGCKNQTRVRGPSLMRFLCDQGRSIGLKHFFYGSTQETLDLLKAQLQVEYPGLEIVGIESPPFRALSEQELKEAADRINNSGAHICWVGLGAPKQERWMYVQRNRVIPVMVGVGAAFDLLAGKIPEAPAWMQSLSLEWLYRLCKEPRRLWRRYVFNNPAFAFLFFFQWLGSFFRKGATK